MVWPTDGIILIDKPAGVTSFGVVARVRRQISQQIGKKAKVGHTGTLDPFATGLMILVAGKECKKASRYSKLDKVYEAAIFLGKISTTDDPEGEIRVINNNEPDLAAVENTLKRFVGTIEQIPPAYSAIKVNGQRAYKLARQGKEVKLSKRKVKIYSLDLLKYDYPVLKIKTKVSSGTYIRTLAKDIGEALGTGGYCASLRRLRVGEWDVAQASRLEGNKHLPQ